jgi:hypothetical protein
MLASPPIEFDKIRASVSGFVHRTSLSTHHVKPSGAARRSSTGLPRRLWKACDRVVDKFFVAALRQSVQRHSRVWVSGFLPTMKPQRMQLPLLVGSGRVTT